MSFDKILATISEDDQRAMLQQAINKRDYNRKYQSKLRVVAKQLTLERKIDTDVLHTISYIKSRYAYELKNFDKLLQQRVEPLEPVPHAFSTWMLVCAGVYKDATDAYSVSSANDSMTLKEFTKLFNLYFIQEGDRYILRESLND